MFALSLTDKLIFMLQIKNTNIFLKGGEIITKVTTEKNGFGSPTLVISNQEKAAKVLKAYKYLGFYHSYSVFFDGTNFFRLTKGLKQYTIKGKQVVIGNEVYHINKHIANGYKVTIDN